MMHDIVQAAAAAPSLAPTTIAEGLLAIALAINTVMTKRGERKTRSVVTTSVEKAVATVKADLQPQLGGIERSLTEIRGIVIGPDGKNGLRGLIGDIHRESKEMAARSNAVETDNAVLTSRVTAVEKRVDGIEARERQ